MVQKGPLASYVPDFSEYPLAPIPLPRPVPPGISVQALGTFGFELINGELQDALVWAELGIPHNALVYRCMLRDPLDCQGYSVEVVGPRAEPTDPPDAPRFVDMFSQENPLTVIAWRRRLYPEAHAGVYLEVRWHPATGETNALVWPSHVPHATAAKHITPGLRLLRDIERRGQPWRPPSASEREAFRTTIVGLIRLTRRQGKEPRQQFIAELYREECSKSPLHTPSVAEMNRSAESAARTLRNHLARYGYTWEEMLALADTAP
jgi:hypothetical protein